MNTNPRPLSNKMNIEQINPQMNTNADIIVGLDIGTTKICAIVGQLTENGKINVLGKGRAPSMGGVSRGMVANISKAEEAIRIAVAAAKQHSNIDIKTVYVGIAGHHIKSLQHRGTLSRKNSDEEISQAELDKLELDMKHLALSPGQEILHVLPQEYRIDDEEGVKDPVGRMGVRIECNYHIITGHVQAARHIFMAVKRAGLEVADLIVEPLASAAAVLSQEEMEAGVALVDIGGGTTDICVFEDGFIRHTASIPVGGDRITKDLQEAFGILKDQAEVVKVNYGSCYPTETMRNQIITVPGLPNRKPKEISQYAIAQVIHARVLDIIEKIDYEIELSGIRNKLGGGIVLTGGGSAMNNITQLFEFETGIEVHLGYPGQNLGRGMVEEIRNPMYSTGLGLVMKGFEINNKQNLPSNLPLLPQTEVPKTNAPKVEKVMAEVQAASEEPETKKSWIKKPNLFNGNWNLMSHIEKWIADGDDFDDKLDK